MIWHVGGEWISQIWDDEKEKMSLYYESYFLE